MDRPETFAKVQQLVIIGAWLLGRVHPVQARSAILHRVHERLPRARARPPARVTAAEERTATILTGTTRSSPAFHVHRHVRGARHSAGDVTSRLTITVVCTALTTAVAPTSVRSSPGRTLRGGRRMSSVNLVARMMAVMVALTGWVALPTSVFAWSHGCGGPNPVTQEQDFVGIAEAHAGATGARAKIEWSASIDPTLCTTVGGDSFASSWVAVVGPTPFDAAPALQQVGQTTRPTISRHSAVTRARSADRQLVPPQSNQARDWPLPEAFGIRYSSRPARRFRRGSEAPTRAPQLAPTT